MRRCYKFRLYPSNGQKEKLQKTLDACRHLYNSALAERKEAWEKSKERVSYRMQQNNLPQLKQENEELQNVHSQVLQDALRRLDKAFKHFFRRVKNKEKPGHPRFKGMDRYGSFTYSQFGFKVKEGRLFLSKIGLLSIKLHRGIEGSVKTCTMKREANRWFAVFAVEKEEAIATRGSIANAIGIDAGLESLITLSTGEAIEPPEFYRKGEERLALEHRRLAKKKKASKNRARQKLKLQITYMKIADQRRDFLHKLSRKLVNEYDFIAYENLNVRNMVRNHYLAKSIHDAAWSMLLGMIGYKAEEAGSRIAKVGPEYTSQECSGCGVLVKKSLSVRTHNCMSCGLVLNRDHNAALNILKKGLEQLQLGQELPEVTPARDEQKEALSMKQEARAFRRG